MRSRWRCCTGPSGSRCCSATGRPAGRTGGTPPDFDQEDEGNENHAGNHGVDDNVSGIETDGDADVQEQFCQ